MFAFLQKSALWAYHTHSSVCMLILSNRWTDQNRIISGLMIQYHLKINSPRIITLTWKTHSQLLSFLFLSFSDYAEMFCRQSIIDCSGFTLNLKSRPVMGVEKSPCKKWMILKHLWSGQFFESLQNCLFSLSIKNFPSLSLPYFFEVSKLRHSISYFYFQIVFNLLEMLRIVIKIISYSRFALVLSSCLPLLSLQSFLAPSVLTE